jgi:PAS domain S-box-containing protein
MQETTVRKWHRYVGVVVAPMIVLQAMSGLLLTIEALSGIQKSLHSVISGRHLPSVAKFWDFLMVEIHFGGGYFGQIYNVLLATGLIALAASGVIVFVKVQQRLRRRPAADPVTRAVTAAPAGPASPLPGGDGGELVPRAVVSTAWRRLHLVLGAATVGMAFLLAVAYYEAFRISVLDAPLADAATEIRLGAARAHLWFEEIMSGDTLESMDTVWQNLDRAEWYARAMLEGAEAGDESDTSILPLADVELREQIGRAMALLGEFRDLTGRRYETADGAGAGTDIDQEYDQVFRELGEASDAVKTALKQAILRDREIFHIVQLGLISASILLGVLVWVTFTRLAGQVDDSVEDLEEARATAEAERRLFRQMLQQAADPILVLDRGATIVDANQVACEALGYPHDELMGIPLAHIEVKHDRRELEELWGQLLPGAPVSMKGTHRRRDGATYPVEVNLRALEWGTRWLVVALARDVTERDRAESRLRDALEKTRRELEERTAELEKTK